MDDETHAALNEAGVIPGHYREKEAPTEAENDSGQDHSKHNYEKHTVEEDRTAHYYLDEESGEYILHDHHGDHEYDYYHMVGSSFG